MPFAASVPGFFPFLRNEKGLRQALVHSYTYTLRPFEAYLAQASIALDRLTPACIAEFINVRAKTLHKSGMLNSTGALRVFLRYLHREGILATDLVGSVPRGHAYRQASVPRAIGWTDVERLLASVDRRSELGKRDYAVLALLVSYGLRARGIAALRLEDFDWSTGRSASRCARAVIPPATHFRRQWAKRLSRTCRFGVPMWIIARFS